MTPLTVFRNFQAGCQQKQDLPMIIKKGDLKILAQKLIDFLGDETPILEDNYWIISSDNWTNFSRQPDADVGSLADDWYFLQRLLHEDSAVSASDLDRLSSILRAISQEINPI